MYDHAGLLQLLDQEEQADLQHQRGTKEPVDEGEGGQ